MRIHNVYEDANGESHFRDLEVEWTDGMAGAKISKRLPGTGMVVCEFTASVSYDTWHRAPRRQYVVNLAGVVELTVSDGETRHIAPGEMLLVEDTAGKGHITKFAPGHRSIYIPIE
jgi:hypothetical protein